MVFFRMETMNLKRTGHTDCERSAKVIQRSHQRQSLMNISQRRSMGIITTTTIGIMSQRHCMVSPLICCCWFPVTDAFLVIPILRIVSFEMFVLSLYTPRRLSSQDRGIRNDETSLRLILWISDVLVGICVAYGCSSASCLLKSDAELQIKKRNRFSH